MTHSRLALAPLLCSFLLVGCEKPKVVEVKTGDEKEEAPATNVKVQLPPSPNFDEGKAPEKWEDGSWSIYGLRSKLDENVKAGETGTEIEVKGWVQEIYVAPPCPEKEVCAPPKQPHIWTETCPVCFGSFFDAGEFRDFKQETLSDLVKSWFSRERK